MAALTIHSKFPLPRRVRLIQDFDPLLLVILLKVLLMALNPHCPQLFLNPSAVPFKILQELNLDLIVHSVHLLTGGAQLNQDFATLSLALSKGQLLFLNLHCFIDQSLTLNLHCSQLNL